MTEYLLQHNANTDWAFATSQETDQALFEARGALADWIGGSADEIVFGANMTTLTLHLGRALGREWRSGDVVVVTELDHHANSDTWRALAKERGLEVRTIRMRPEEGRLDQEDVARKRSEEHTSELQSPCNLVCRLLLEKKKKNKSSTIPYETLMTLTVPSCLDIRLLRVLPSYGTTGRASLEWPISVDTR